MVVDTDGALVLLVHGSPGSPRSWEAVARALTERRSAVRVQRLALPGWDAPEPGDVEPLGFDEIVERLAAQVAASARPAVLVGFSAGALFAMALAAQAGWALRGLLLLEPMGLHAVEALGADPAGAQRIRAAFEAYFTGVDAEERDAIRPIWDVWNPPGSYAVVPEPVKAYLRTWAPLNVRDGRAGLRAALDARWFGRITAPTITTYGTAAPPVWRQFAESLATLLPSAEPRPVPGAMHTILDTHPLEVCALIEELLDRPAAPTGGAPDPGGAGEGAQGATTCSRCW